VIRRGSGILVAELDSTWVDYNSLIMALRGALPRKLMPALVVSRMSWCGRYEVEKPHLLWPLPCEVGRNGKSRMAPQRFFRRVQRAIINALIPLGSDPGRPNIIRSDRSMADPFIAEYYADLEHNDDGSLIVTREHDAVDPEEAASRRLRAMAEGKRVPMGGTLRWRVNLRPFGYAKCRCRRPGSERCVTSHRPQ
jgi:hypothetical protein